MNKIAVIAGAGPAGLTAALELLRRSDIVPIVFEVDRQVGGISKTVEYRGNRMDLGGHRFFSKSDWVTRWWQEILPIATSEVAASSLIDLTYQRQSKSIRVRASNPVTAEAVMLVRQRLSRIFYRRRFFDYPIKLNAETIKNLGAHEMLRIGLSYGRARFKPRSPEVSLEDFLVNRFGERLYRTFFKDYTEKVWGVPCRDISAQWGAQRIKGLSVTKALSHALSKRFRLNPGRRTVETSLIERFLYPKLGPGQMWEEVTRRVRAGGGTVHLKHRVIGIERQRSVVTAVQVLDEVAGSVRRVACDYMIATLPICELVQMLVPEHEQVMHVAQNLPYRDFVTAGLLLHRMRSGAGQGDVVGNGMPPDNWIYIQEPDVKIGRLQVFNNWSPALVANPEQIWVGLEYFCGENDELWATDDASFIDFSARELEKIGLIDRHDVIDGTVVRVPKAYPAYFGEYRNFNVVREWLDTFTNLYSVGRNGMHRYNNQDHSMLSARCAVDSITNTHVSRLKIWEINAEDGYHEEFDSDD